MEEIIKTIEDIKSRIPSFKISAVYSHLKELNKTKPNEAQALNNPIGWEKVWNQIRD